MSATYTAAATAKPALKCKICGCATARGSRLCSQCSAALKRARQVPTVMSQFMPVALSGYGAAAGNVAHHQTVRFRNAPPPRRSAAMPIGWWAFFAFAVFVAAVIVTGYFAAVEIADDPGSKAAPAPVAETASAAKVESAQRPSAAVAASDEPAPAEQRQASPETSPPQVPARPPMRRPAASAGTAGNALPTIPAGLSMTAADSNADSNPSEGAGAPLPPAPAAAPQEPAVPDRWQAMQDAIASCARDGFFAGALCEQRVRLKYCDGYWGDVAQCARGIRQDSAR